MSSLSICRITHFAAETSYHRQSCFKPLQKSTGCRRMSADVGSQRLRKLHSGGSRESPTLLSLISLGPFQPLFYSIGRSIFASVTTPCSTADTCIAAPIDTFHLAVRSASRCNLRLRCSLRRAYSSLRLVIRHFVFHVRHRTRRDTVQVGVVAIVDIAACEVSSRVELSFKQHQSMMVFFETRGLISRWPERTKRW